MADFANSWSRYFSKRKDQRARKCVRNHLPLLEQFSRARLHVFVVRHTIKEKNKRLLLVLVGKFQPEQKLYIIQTGSANGKDLSILQFVEPYSHHSSNFNRYDKSSTILLSPELNSFQNKSSFAKLTEVNLL